MSRFFNSDDPSLNILEEKLTTTEIIQLRTRMVFELVEVLAKEITWDQVLDAAIKAYPHKFISLKSSRENETNQYKRWRDAVKFRDHDTCQKCRGKLNLEAHHIIPRSLRPDLINEFGNGITLCDRCHDFYHSIFTIDDCNLKTLNQFLERDD